MYAAEKGHTAVIQALLDGGAMSMPKTAKGNTALTWAANEGKVEAAKALIAGGAESISRIKVARLRLLGPCSTSAMRLLKCSGKLGRQTHGGTEECVMSNGL